MADISELIYKIRNESPLLGANARVYIADALEGTNAAASDALMGAVELVDNLTTAEAGQGALDARQGYELDKKIDSIIISGGGALEIEEGTWTPGASIKNSYDVHNGYYIKIGATVVISLDLSFHALESAPEFFEITGAPYLSTRNASGSGTMLVPGASGYAPNGYYLGFGSNRISPRLFDINTGEDRDVFCTAGEYYAFSGTIVYQTD